MIVIKLNRFETRNVNCYMPLISELGKLRESLPKMLFETVKPLLLIAGLKDNQNDIDLGESQKILEFFIDKTKVSSWDSQKSFTIANLEQNGEQAQFYDGSTSGASIKFDWPKKHVPSLISPRSKTSDLYPDGIISLAWILKYQERHPSAIILFHRLNESTERDPLGAHGVKKDQDEISANLINSLRIRVDDCGLKLVVCFLLKQSQPSNLFN